MDGFLAKLVKYLLFITNFLVFVSENTAKVFYIFVILNNLR